MDSIRNPGSSQENSLGALRASGQNAPGRGRQPPEATEKATEVLVCWGDSPGADAPGLPSQGDWVRSLSPQAATARSLPQDLEQPHEVVVRLEAQDDLSAVLAADPDLDAHGELLPQLVLQALDVGG